MSVIKHTEEFVVRSYEIDQTGKTALPVIANYFQEAAGKNAKDLTFDIEDLHKKGVTWVLYRLHIKMDKFPRRWQRVVVNTWPSSGDGIRAFRDYELTDENGMTMGVGVSQWMVLNIKNRRPVRIPEEIIEMGLDVDEHKLSIEKSSFPSMDSPDRITTLTVSSHDIDMNHHVNNVTYIEWMTGFMPDEMPPKLTCHEINIQFHKEASLYQQIVINTRWLNDNTYLHTIEKADSGHILAEGISVWKD
ncbi:acyl-[acyl-carrier-protein] thioesterase [Rhodohalobacter sp. 8-1]|uniref:acyl-[acyl-carrier-protein] thioesterase n=1 Tax=Rhodohalobacter sp. 8-1 TaxID=3131972 RepID=UPI0030EC50B3